MVATNLDRFANLTYRGQNSYDYGIYLKHPINLTHAIPDYNKTHINGRNGDFIQDQGSFQNVTETFDIVVRMPEKFYQNQFEYESAITEWLRGNDYSYLRINKYPSYVFEAVVDAGFTLNWDDDDPRFATGQISFNCKPFYRRIDGIIYQPLPETGIVYNTEKVPATPDWHFIANGNFTLTVNDFPYEFSGINGEVWLNGQEGNLVNKLDGDYTNLINTNMRLSNNTPPVLESEMANTIKITSGSENVSKAEYKPNWGRLI